LRHSPEQVEQAVEDLRANAEKAIAGERK